MRTLIDAVRAINHLPGDAVHLGMALGKTARIIRDHLQMDKFLWLYDTFNSEIDPKGLEKLRGMHRTRVIQGAFPQSAFIKGRPEKVCFVHLNVDSELSTQVGLNFFANLLVPGGIILVHNYGNPSLQGVGRAVDFFMEFFSRATNGIFEFLRPETIYMLVRRRTMEEWQSAAQGVTAPCGPGRDPVPQPACLPQAGRKEGL